MPLGAPCRWLCQKSHLQLHRSHQSTPLCCPDSSFHRRTPLFSRVQVRRSHHWTPPLLHHQVSSFAIDIDTELDPTFTPSPRPNTSPCLALHRHQPSAFGDFFTRATRYWNLYLPTPTTKSTTFVVLTFGLPQPFATIISSLTQIP
ncbi:hypothetical protein VNO78_16362 [Psophocarpus tetragonolobus]|uniref:Uncharacterized protein n=1 Tax=Psophocarpus tetragonolobus TaxID=3891 RepID=A0AAN9SM64_PSOTE